MTILMKLFVTILALATMAGFGQLSAMAHNPNPQNQDLHAAMFQGQQDAVRALLDAARDAGLDMWDFLMVPNNPGFVPLLGALPVVHNDQEDDGQDDDWDLYD